MEITEYERLVSSETQVLQSKMTRAIDAAMNSIQTKQSELMAEIKSDPRKSAIRKKNIKLNLQISTEKENDPDLSDLRDNPAVKQIEAITEPLLFLAAPGYTVNRWLKHTKPK